ncbi:MAG: putative hydrolases or acyltransferases (alpha/beta hydrolase superfamily) [Roseibaca calidilacus]|uniref:Pimeloyl-ACP methyl ester carboxylesterase n=1 Tax=Roseibaca calidilacus TaxID=1666912 RepID=A0A0P7VXB2_9RHOB|nr:alpha/beta hydrolase [Roseibaca calidilacus]KPP91828.1 MAG: putative hydrolases or acyltransferases (alpha/beta hydrolase superfamily) [Roseibaca calidilacus]CUX82448.1 Pimeloyl-ACP methyl ester carboxylesterase [Roseibaca calidilacus]
MTLTRLAGKVALFSAIAATTMACAQAADTVQTPPQGAYVALDGGRVHAVVQGQGPDLVLIHGANGNARDFTFDLAGRMAQEFRVISFDRPGFGHSDAFGGLKSPMAQAQVLRDAAAELGVDRPILLGHSYGGAVAMAWALQAPGDVAGLTLLAPAVYPWPGELGLWYQLSSSWLGQKVVLPLVAGLAPRSAVDSSLEGVFAPNPVPEGYMDHLGYDLTLRASQLALNARQVDGLKGYVEAMSPGYPALTMPIEIIHGDQDTTVGLSFHSQRMADTLDNAQLTILPDVGHMPHHARPKDVADAIRRTYTRARSQ